MSTATHTLALPPVRYRACEKCDHGTRMVTSTSCCTHPALGFRSVHQLRAPGGDCGPEAKFLEFPGLNG